MSAAHQRLLGVFADAGDQRAVYRRSSDGEEMVAIGVCDRAEPSRRRRIFWRAFDVERDGTDRSWSGFERTASYTPQVVAIRRGDDAIDVFGDGMPALDDAVDVPPADLSGGATITERTPHDEDAFVEGVRRVADEGALPKAVVARRLEVVTAQPMAPAAIVRRLIDAYPNCTVFAIAPGGVEAPVFVGATPERLVEIDDGTVATMALAGTTRQVEHQSIKEAEQALLASAKDRREHRFVRDMIVDVLQPFCRSVDAADEPAILRLGEMSHLHTPIRATLDGDCSIVDVADALHPTPAVCGTPRDRALSLIRDVEPFDRGLYAGVLGFVDDDGDGQADVLLRAGLIEGRQALLYAGAGITADSDVDVEWRETDQKFRPLLDAIEGGSR